MTLKTFYGEGRLNENTGTYVVEAFDRNEAELFLHRATMLKGMVKKPAFLKLANEGNSMYGNMKGMLEEAIEYGLAHPKGQYDKAYSLGDNVTFLEFYDADEKYKYHFRPGEPD